LNANVHKISALFCGSELQEGGHARPRLVSLNETYLPARFCTTFELKTPKISFAKGQRGIRYFQLQIKEMWSSFLFNCNFCFLSNLQIDRRCTFENSEVSPRSFHCSIHGASYMNKTTTAKPKTPILTAVCVIKDKLQRLEIPNSRRTVTLKCLCSCSADANANAAFSSRYQPDRKVSKALTCLG